MDPPSSYRWSSQVRASLAGLSLEAKRNWMDAKIREKEEDLLGIKSFRNTLSPFTSLPNELIVEIIVHTQVADLERDLEWLKLTHICRHWRAVALSTPRLWMELNICNNVPLMDAILERSEGAKLQVISTGLTSSMLSTYTETILRAHADRVRHLRIGHSSYRCDLKDICFSTLERLEVKGASRDDSDDENGRGNVNDQADANFDFAHDSTRFPRLRLLFMWDMAFPRASQVLASLVHLELSNLHNPPPSIDSLLDILESMNHLEFLKIERCQLSFAATHGKPPRMVSFSSLRRLCLGDEPLNLAFLLPHLVIPSYASLQLEIVITDANSDEDELIISALPHDKSCIPNFPALRNVHLVLHEYGFRCDADVQDVVAMPPPFQLCSLVEDAHNGGLSDVDDRRHIHEFGRLFSALSVTILDLDCGISCMDDAEYRSLLRGFPHVDHLTISTDEIVHFLVALGTHTADSPSHGEPLCQKMKTLVVGGIWAELSDVHAEVIPALLNALRSRASCGMVLETLVLRKFVDDVRNEVEVVAELETLVDMLEFEDVEDED